VGDGLDPRIVNCPILEDLSSDISARPVRSHMGHLSRDFVFLSCHPPNFRVRFKKNLVRGADFERGKFPGEEGAATLIGERRRGTLPLVATLKYHDPAMWPVHVAARRFHPLAIRRTGPRQPLNPPCISASYSVPRRNIFLLISIAYHRRYGRAVWIDPVV